MCLAVRKFIFSLSWRRIFFKLGEIFSRYKLWMILLMTPTSKLSSFPNRTFALRVFPSSITFPAETIFLTEFLPTPVASATFAITAPALNCGLFPLLLSSWKYFATFSIICCSSTLIDFPLFRLEHPGSDEMMSAIFQATQKTRLLGLGPHFIIDDINYKKKIPLFILPMEAITMPDLLKFIFTWLLLIE